jgi:endonuclease-3
MKRQQRIDALKTAVFEMYPNAETELYYNTEFQLLIAILMSAQATDRQVNIINRNFFEFLKTPEDGVKL